MKFSTRQDIEAPLDFVFERVSDFPSIERQLLRRNVELQRIDEGDGSGLGMAWRARAVLRGKQRDCDARVTEFDPPNGYELAGRIDGMRFIVTLRTMELSRQRSRLAFALELKPESLTARLVLQSARLAKGRLSRTFEQRVIAHCRDIEDGYRARS